MYWTDGLVSFTVATLVDGASISGHPDRHGGRQTHHGHQLIRKLHVRGLETGKDYMLVVTSKRYRFATQMVNLSGNLSDVNLIGLEYPSRIARSQTKGGLSGPSFLPEIRDFAKNPNRK